MNNIDKRTKKRKLGDIGENVACEFLKRRRFEIVERNYLRKWGEIDIVAKKGSILHFVEVKSVSRVTSYKGESFVRPEENMHPGKLRRLARTIQIYLLHKKHEEEWQLDLITAHIDTGTRQAKVEMIENIVI